MSKSYIEEKDQEKTDSRVHELYLMEKLYQVMMEDKKRAKPTTTDRELYLLEQLYQAMVKDKKRNHKSYS